MIVSSCFNHMRDFQLHVQLEPAKKVAKKVAKNVTKELNNLVVMTTDSLQLLGHASFELSQVRRDEIKPNLHEDYGDLCSSSTPVTEVLQYLAMICKHN